jgi:hypothetical protein
MRERGEARRERARRARRIKGANAQAFECMMS